MYFELFVTGLAEEKKNQFNINVVELNEEISKYMKEYDEKVAEVS